MTEKEIITKLREGSFKGYIFYDNYDDEGNCVEAFLYEEYTQDSIGVSDIECAAVYLKEKYKL